MKSIGQKLKAVREKLRISQEELSALVTEKTDGKISRQTISMWESGVTKPTTNKIMLVAKALEISPTELTGNVIEDVFDIPVPDNESLVPILTREWIAEHESEFFTGKLYSGASVPIPLSMEKLFSASTTAQKPYAVFVENDGLERWNYYENDLVILDANKQALQGIVALIKHYGVLALRLIYNLPDGSVLLQNDDGEVVVNSDEKQADSVYKCFGVAIGCIRAKPKAQPLVRKK